MPTIFESLDVQDLGRLKAIAMGVHLDGECYAFAIALHRGLGWPIVGVMEGSIASRTGVIRHAVVRAPDGKHWDVRGHVEEGQIGAPFSLEKPYVLKPITETDLFKARPVHENVIERASLLAQAFWPELPWKKEALHARMLSFTGELEALCREHRIWIKLHILTSIVLGEAYGDEKGFRVRPTLDGQYIFDREL